METPRLHKQGMVNSGMRRQNSYPWNQAPFLRLLVPFAGGIVLQYYGRLPVQAAWMGCATGVAGLLLFNLRTSYFQYRFSWINGCCMNIFLLATGLLLTYYKDPPHQRNWINLYYRDKDLLTAMLEETPVQKGGLLKANASVQQLWQADTLRQVRGRIILYFTKEASTQLTYGTRVLFNQALQPIRNAGNPAAFNYQRYTAFQGIYQQVLLQPDAYRVLSRSNANILQQMLLATRERVLHVVTQYVPGEKEAGLAEALLVGYKEDLDKTLVQSYTNTGVVHIIAISGMHLGLIYWLLNLLLQPLKKRKQTSWLVPVVIITGLWLFSFLAGGGPSILRAAVMFTCLVTAESVQRRTYMYNSLAASAFLLLCINPFWLWDVGFQLSYTAVLSIVLFAKPFSNLFHFSNQLLVAIWKLVAVTLAAQVLTTPVSIYHFHQFPMYFLFTNVVAVPLSSIVVLLEIALCAVSFLPLLAKPTGVLLHWLLYNLNSFIEHMEHLPFSLWNNLQINMLQLIWLYALVIAAAWWLMQKSTRACMAALVCTLGFLCIRTYSFINAGQRHQLLIYNIPRHQAIDFISGRKYFFKGDAQLLTDKPLQNFTVNPARIQNRTASSDSLAGLFCSGPLYVFNHTTIALVDHRLNFSGIMQKIKADVIIVSKNPPVELTQVMQAFTCRQFIFDASNAPWKVNKWKAEAAKLGLSCFYTVDNGAFVMNMD